MSIAALDYGGKRIGIAISDSGILATPHKVIPNDANTLEKLDQLARTLGVETWVVGIAKRTRTRDGEARFRGFAEELRQKTCRPVVLWDETLSTVAAEERLRQGGRKAARTSDIDMYAAAVILQSYLDERSRRQR